MLNPKAIGDKHNVEQGCSHTESHGIFTRDEASGRRSLRLDLYLIGLTPSRITPGNLRDFQHLRVPSLRFEVRPDLRSVSYTHLRAHET